MNTRNQELPFREIPLIMTLCTCSYACRCTFVDSLHVSCWWCWRCKFRKLWLLVVVKQRAAVKGGKHQGETRLPSGLHVSRRHVKEILVRGQIFCCERFHDTSLCQSVCIVLQSLHAKDWSPGNVAFCTVGMQLSRGLRNA